MLVPSGGIPRRLPSFAVWPAVALVYGIAVQAFLDLEEEFGVVWLAALLPLAIAACVLAIIWLASVVRAVQRRRLRDAAAAVAAPLLGYAVALLWSPHQPGLQLRLLVDQPWLQWHIARAGEPPGHRHLLTGWGDAGSAVEGPLRIYTLIYDEDGTVADEARLRATRRQDGPLTLRHIRGDFYLMTQFP